MTGIIIKNNYKEHNNSLRLKPRDEIDVDVQTLGGREFHSEMVLGRKELKKKVRAYIRLKINTRMATSCAVSSLS